MNEWVKTLVTSGVVAAGVSWLATSYQIEQELHSKEGQAGYEALVNADTLSWHADSMLEEAKRKKDDALAEKARKMKREADELLIVARLKIAAFGDESVVEAMSDYFSIHLGADKACSNKDKFRSDTQIYKAIRNTLGVGGTVTDEQLANVVFLCSLN